VLDPAQLLDRLGQRLDFLRGGRDADPRQQTLRATIEWSYDLLHTTEQELFARFAVFPGGCTLEAAENVCDADIDLLQSLLEKSLLRRTAERYWMLETIREFAAERLADLPGASELRRRQADWLVRLARESEPALEGSADQAGWLSRLAAEVENIRAALAWARDSNAAVMLDLAGHLGLFFWLSGFIEEGLNWIETAIARDDCAQPVIRADALAAAAWLGLYGGHLDRARGHADACAALRRELGDDRGLARALREQGKARVAVEPEVARSLLEEAARVSRRTDDAWNLAIVTNNLGDLALYDGQYQRAFRLCGESLKLRKSRGDAWGAAIAGFNVGLALMALGRFEEAGVQLRETLALSVKVELTLTIAETLVGLAAVELDGGDAERATRLLGAAETLFAETEEEPFPFEAALRERTTARARSELTAEAFQSAWQHGYRARRVDTVEYALRRRSDAAGPRQMPFPSAEI
jgi:tetratricopeptide (TPR) repeat protein